MLAALKVQRAQSGSGGIGQSSAGVESTPWEEDLSVSVCSTFLEGSLVGI